MRRRFLITMLLVPLAACSPDDSSASSSGALIITDRCEISGLGALASGDFFLGDARGGDLGASGSWRHLGDRRLVLASAEWILCRINGATLGDFGGSATMDGRSGYTFRVHVQDFGDPRPPTWVESPPEVQTIRATRTYRPSRWDDGSVSIDDRAIVTIPGELPVTVGGASNQWAWLTFQLSETYEIATCRYRGDATPPHGGGGGIGGERYVLERCTGGDDEDGHARFAAGDRVDVRWMTLHVQGGDHRLPDRSSAETTVSVDLDVTPLVRVDPSRDYYRIQVWDDSTSEIVYQREGELDIGNLRVHQLF